MEHGGGGRASARRTRLLLKYISAAQRPNETTNPDEWFQGGDSFPSMHVSAAFAIGTVFRRIRRRASIAGWRRTLGLWSCRRDRLPAHCTTSVHWFSDVVAGAAIGIVHRAIRHASRRCSTHRHSGFSVVPSGRAAPCSRIGACHGPIAHGADGTERQGPQVA